MRTMMKVLVALIAFFVIGGSVVRAEEAQKVYKAPEHETDQMGVKMVRGITNAATGIFEFPRQIYRSGNEDGWLLALPYGLARGLAMTIVRTGYGVLETAFFFIPFNDSYSSALNPAFVWEKEAPPTPQIDE